MAKSLTMAGVVGLSLGRRRPALARLGGALVTAAAAVERFAVFQAGIQSAEDPQYVVSPQRQRLAQAFEASNR
jgi:hypothetical protein